MNTQRRSEAVEVIEALVMPVAFELAVPAFPDTVDRALDSTPEFQSPGRGVFAEKKFRGVGGAGQPATQRACR